MNECGAAPKLLKRPSRGVPVALIGSSRSVMDSASPCDLSLDGTGKTDVAYTE